MNNTPSEKRMPAAQHEGAVDSGKTAGGTGGADLAIRPGKKPYGVEPWPNRLTEGPPSPWMLEMGVLVPEDKGIARHDDSWLAQVPDHLSR